MYPMSFIIFTAGICILWLAAFRWAWRQRPFYAFILVFASLYCFLSEFAAIRLGKYFYGKFPLMICVGSVGSDLPWPFHFLVRAAEVGVCEAPNWCLPLAVMAMEGTLILTILRTSDMLLPGSRARPLLDGLVAVNLDVILDPVASVTRMCGGQDPHLGGLGFWTWFTGDKDLGYWFGVPLLNYTTWFVSVAVFTATIRVARRFVRSHRRRILAELAAAVIALLFLLLIEFVLILALQTLLELDGGLIWQGGITVVLLGTSLVVVLFSARGFNRENAFEWVPVAFPLFLLLFCLGALIANGGFAGKEGLFLVWPVTFILGAGYALAPYSKSWAAKRRSAGGR